MATVVRTALRRIGGRALRPSLAAAAHQQPHPTPPRSRVAAPLQTRPSSSYVPALLPPTPGNNMKGLTRSYSSNVPAVIAQNPGNFKKVHLEVSGRLLPVIGFTDMSVYKVSFCSDNPDFAGNLVRDFMKALQSDRREDLADFLSHEVSIVEIKKIVGEGVMEIKMQSLEHTVEVKFELESLRDLVMAEGVSTRNEVKAVHKELTESDFVKVVIQGCVANCIFMLLVAMAGKLTFATASEVAMAITNALSA